jgi:WD40 repeat protein
MKVLLRTFPFVLAIGVSAQTMETTLQLGHELSVLSISTHPDSNFVVTGSRDKSAKLWELSTGREVRSFLGHEGSINCIDFSRDGKYMITSSGDMTARIWEVSTGNLVFCTPKEEKYLTAAAFSPDDKFFITAGYPNEAIVWDFNSKKEITRIKVNADQGAGYGINLAVSPDGKWLAIGEDNRTANVYATGNWEKKFTFKHETGYCGGCATWVDFSHDSKMLLMGSNKSPVKKYDLATGELVKKYVDEIQDLRGLEFSNEGDRILIGTEKEIILLDNVTGQEVLRTAPTLNANINEIKFARQKSHLLIACDNNEAYLWNYKTQSITKKFSGLLNERDKGGVTYNPNDYWQSHIAKYVRFKNKLLLTKDGKELIKGKFGTKIKKWDLASGQATMEYAGHDKASFSYNLSKDGKLLVTGGGDGKIIIWDVQTGDSLKTIKAHREPIFDVHFTNDEKRVASASWDATFKMYDIETGQRTHYFDLQNNSVYNFLIHPTDLYVVLARLDNTLQIVEFDTQKPVRDFIGHTDMISSIQLNKEGTQLLSTSWDGSARIWDIATGLMTKKFYSGKAIHAGIYSPDEKYIYTAGADRVVTKWDIATSTRVASFEGHQAEITSLIVGRDDKMLISHSLDGITKFWDLASGKEFFEHIHFGEREWMAKNPDGYFNGSEKARQYIHFVEGFKTYGVDQFFNEFYRPDLLPQIFQSRGSEQLKGVGERIRKSPPPAVRVAVLPATDPSQAEVYVRMTNHGGGIADLRLYHNGKQIPIDKKSFSFPPKNESTVYRHTVGLVSGLNTFAATAVNDEKIESDPSTAEIFSEQGYMTGKCYILSIGINEYKNPRMKLNYAKPDAESFAALVDQKSTSLFKKVELHTLYDEEASRENILKKLEDLGSQISSEDVFIFYYAGHGSMVDNRFYFIPTESIRLYDQASLKKEAIEASVLQEKLKNIRALKQLIVMDACQSGGSVELLANRGAAEEKAIAQLSRSAGIHVMASAGSEQFAAEFSELGHGLFTYLLIKALDGEADGAPKDGKVTIYELKSYLDDQVPEMTRKLKGKPQYPYTFSRGHDFPVVVENR